MVFSWLCRTSLLLVLAARPPALGEDVSAALSADAAPCPAVHTEAEVEIPRPFPGFTRVVLAEAGLGLKDGFHLLGAPVRWRAREWGYAGLAVGSLVLLSAADGAITRQIAERRSPVPDRVLDAVEPLGSTGVYGVLATFFVTGLLRGDERARNVAVDGVVARLCASGLTSVLKEAVGRSRPSEGEGPSHLEPFGGRQSFPSGHATHAFAVASVIAASYPQAWIKIAAYSVAGLVGLQRVRHEAHYATDVTAGALIGTVVGWSVVKFNRRQREHRNAPAESRAASILVTPSADGRRYGFVARVQF